MENASHSSAIGSAQLAFCPYGTIRIACDFREGVLSRARRPSPWPESVYQTALPGDNMHSRRGDRDFGQCLVPNVRDQVCERVKWPGTRYESRYHRAPAARPRREVQETPRRAMKRSLGLLAIDLVADRDLDLQGILDRDIESDAFLYKVLFKYPNASRSLSRGGEPRAPARNFPDPRAKCY